MVVTTMTILAAAAAALAAVGEVLHRHRVRRAARLAFGPVAKPRLWTYAVPPLRVLGVGLGVWGALVLGEHVGVELLVGFGLIAGSLALIGGLRLPRLPRLPRLSVPRPAAVPLAR